MVNILEHTQGKRYGVIYADPPWHWESYSSKGEGRSAKKHYTVMNLDGIKTLPVQDIAADDCVLMMWAIDSMLPQALDVMNAWGFTFKTIGFHWAKLNKSANELMFCKDDFFVGLGYHTRSNVEQCLLGTRGNPKRLNADVRKLIVSPRREHSRKPEEVYERIGRLYAGPYLEMFARTQRPGWDAWGNETDKFNNGAHDA